MLEVKHELRNALPFAMDPVVYDFSINQRGTYAEFMGGQDEEGEALMPSGYYALVLPDAVRRGRHELSPTRRAELDAFGEACRVRPELSGMVQVLFDQLLPRQSRKTEEGQSLEELLETLGFDRVQHEQIREDLRDGRIGLAQNRLPASTNIQDVQPGDVTDLTLTEDAELEEARADLETAGYRAIREGRVAVVTLAAGVGSRWTHGAGVVKALHPFCKMAGVHRSFLEVHLGKSRRMSHHGGNPIPHVITTSYLTHEPIREFLDLKHDYQYPGPVLLSPGRTVGLRMIPMTRDLRFAWEEMPQQMLDEQAQKVRDSLRAALIHWAEEMGEGSDYTDNVPVQCLHPVGHWFEIPNMLKNGVLLNLIETYPDLQVLMMHNIDTVGADVSPLVLGQHLASDAGVTVEVITRRVEDRGGGLARVDGTLRLIEGMALPHEEDEFELSYYNSNTMWIDVDRLLNVFELDRDALRDDDKVAEAVRAVAARMPTYVTLKDVKKRWGHGQEDIYPVAQFEKLWGDMTGLPEMDCRYVRVPRMRGQQLKEQAQLDGWVRDGSADYVASLCEW
jgi:hypothetical protein